MNDDHRTRRADRSVRLSVEGPRTARRARRRWGGLAMAIGAAALGLAACGGGSPSSPQVASLGTSTTTGAGHAGGSATTAPKGKPTQLMDEWATCMRSHGDPNQTDPTIDQYGVINITMPKGTSQTISSQVHGSTGPCSQYELAAEKDLEAANPVAPPPTQAQLVAYGDCMRTHGVPNYPALSSAHNGELNFRAAGVDPNSATFKSADKVCGKQVNAPAWWVAGTGPPGDVVVSSAGIGPNGPVGGNTPRSGTIPVQGGNGGVVSGG